VWKPDYIAWSLDGVEVRRRTDAHYSVRDMDKYSLLYMNFWTPMWNDWGSGRDDSTMPWEAKYDYVEAYDWDEATDTFTLRFRDDFDTLDQNIWRVSDNWSFNDNSSLFVENHTFVRDGNLILKMDKVHHPPQPNPSPSPNPTPTPTPTPNPDVCPTPDPVTPCPSLNLDAQAFRYGDLCEEKHDRSACANSFSNCYQSWPAIDPNGWDSELAQCRTLPAQQLSTDYSYGTLTEDQSAGSCGDNCEDRCRWSWPSSDTLKWKSDDLMARCMPQGFEPYDFTN